MLVGTRLPCPSHGLRLLGVAQLYLQSLSSRIKDIPPEGKTKGHETAWPGGGLAGWPVYSPIRDTQEPSLLEKAGVANLHLPPKE